MFQIKFAGLTLDGAAEWPEEIPSRATPDRFARRQGAIIESVPFLAERRIKVQGEVSTSTESALKNYLTSLGAKLHAGVNKLYLRDDGRYINAVKGNYGYSYRGNEAASIHAKYFIEFIAGDPYWYSDTQETSTQSNVSASPFSFALTNTGGEFT